MGAMNAFMACMLFVYMCICSLLLPPLLIHATSLKYRPRTMPSLFKKNMGGAERGKLAHAKARA